MYAAMTSSPMDRLSCSAAVMPTASWQLQANGTVLHGSLPEALNVDMVYRIAVKRASNKLSPTARCITQSPPKTTLKSWWEAEKDQTILGGNFNS